MEASALPAPSGLARTRLSLGAPLLRLRSDEQLVALFRGGNNDAFRAIHDRYRQRLYAYTRQMLCGRQDAEDALQDVFVRAYSGLRANDRELALRAWLYRVAHNRCIDELRRPAPPAPEVIELVGSPSVDPIAIAEQRESLRRLIADVRRLPDQQRSALLMRELTDMSYVEVADALGVSVAAVKSLLVRARVSLAAAAQARDTACAEVREDLVLAHDRGVRPGSVARRHLRDCTACREFRSDLRGASRQLAALTPALGPVGVVAKILSFGGGAGGGAAAGTTIAAGGGVAAAGGLLGTGGIVSVGAFASGAGHVATLLATAVVAAGGAAEIGHTIAPAHHAHHRPPAPAHTSTPPPAPPVPVAVPPPVEPAVAAPAPQPVATSTPAPQPVATQPVAPARRTRAHRSSRLPRQPVVPFQNTGDPTGTGATVSTPSAGTGGAGTAGSSSGTATTPTSTSTTSTGSPGTTASTGSAGTPAGAGSGSAAEPAPSTGTAAASATSSGATPTGTTSEAGTTPGAGTTASTATAG